MKSPIGSVRIPEAKGTQDYFGFNYYTREYVTFDLLKARHSVSGATSIRKDAEMSDHGFLANEPDGMFEGLKWVTRMFPNLPIIVSENGVNSADDIMRPRYMAQHIHQMWRAVNFNWPIKGYFHWSLVDNFEWELRLDASLRPVGTGCGYAKTHPPPKRGFLRRDLQRERHLIRDGAEVLSRSV